MTRPCIGFGIDVSYFPNREAYARDAIMSPVIPGRRTWRISWKPASPSQAAYSGSL
jgi:hypothetical protein